MKPFIKKCSILILSNITILFIGVLNKGCTSIRQSESMNSGTIGVEFEFKEKNMCNNGLSPEIRLNNIPKNTKQLKVTLKDESNPLFNHGGGIVEFNNNDTIKEGSLKSYYGPCPPRDFFGKYKYCFKVEAIDSIGNVIAWGRNCKYHGW